MPDSSSFDFTGLTRRQKELLSAGGWDSGRPLRTLQPTSQIVRKLLDRGLLTSYDVQDTRGWPTVTFTCYAVPESVARAWAGYRAARAAKGGGRDR